MSSISALSAPKYEAVIHFSTGSYRFNNEWVSSAGDSTSNGWEKMGDAGWSPTNDDVATLIEAAKSATNSAGENGDYAFAYHQTTSKFYRTHKESGEIDVNTAGKWVHSQGDHVIDTNGSGLGSKFSPTTGEGALVVATNIANFSSDMFPLSNGDVLAVGRMGSSEAGHTRHSINEDFEVTTELPVHIESETPTLYCNKVALYPCGVDKFLVSICANTNALTFGFLDYSAGGLDSLADAEKTTIPLPSGHIPYSEIVNMTRIDDNFVLVWWSQFNNGIWGFILDVSGAVPILVGGVTQFINLIAYPNFIFNTALTMISSDLGLFSYIIPNSTIVNFRINLDTVTGAISSTALNLIGHSTFTHNGTLKGVAHLIAPSGNLAIGLTKSDKFIASMFTPEEIGGAAFAQREWAKVTSNNPQNDITIIGDKYSTDGTTIAFLSAASKAVRLKIPKTGVGIGIWGDEVATGVNVNNYLDNRNKGELDGKAVLIGGKSIGKVFI